MLCVMNRSLRDNEAHPISTTLGEILRDAGCESSAPREDQRAAVEALAAQQPSRLQELDEHLLDLRERETADTGLPLVIGGVRRGHLVGWDRVTTTWVGWDEQSGARWALRCLRPRWRRDPVMHRRLALGEQLASNIRGLVPMRFEGHADWPHVAYRLSGIPLSELLPTEDPPQLLTFARWLGLALATTLRLHHRGLLLGTLAPAQILLTPEGLSLVWLDPLDGAPKEASSDLRQLALAFTQLDPDGLHPLAQTLQPWCHSPPASASEAATMLRRALADELVTARHRLALRSRTADRESRTARLYTLGQELARALPPPSGRSCLRAGHDRTLYLIESDGRSVRGGTAAGVPPRGLPPLYTPSRGLDAPATRRLLRAWARRGDGDLKLQASAQRRWQAGDAQGQALVRWLTAASRLRRAQLLLAYRLRRA